MNKLFRNILCPTDFSDDANRALLYGTQVAKLFGADIHLLHATVLHDFGGSSPLGSYQVFEQAASKRSQDALNKLLPGAEREELIIHRVERRGIAPAPVILSYCEEKEIDLIILSTHGRRGLRRLILGSVTQEVVRFATCPVLTVHGQSTLRSTDSNSILIPVDLSPLTPEIIKVGAEFAKWMDCRMVLMHTKPSNSLWNALQYESLGIGDSHGSIRTHLEEQAKLWAPEVKDLDIEVAEGDVGENLMKYAKDLNPEMVVMGSHYASPLDRLILGSVAEQTLQRLNCPILTLKPPVESSKTQCM